MRAGVIGLLGPGVELVARGCVVAKPLLRKRDDGPLVAGAFVDGAEGFAPPLELAGGDRRGNGTRRGAASMPGLAPALVEPEPFELPLAAGGCRDGFRGDEAAPVERLSVGLSPVDPLGLVPLGLDVGPLLGRE